MKKVVLRLAKRNVLDKVGFANTVVLQMNGNPYFATPAPTLGSITTAANQLFLEWEKVQGGAPAAGMNAKEKALDLLLTAEGGYVEAIANASPLLAVTIILSAGMEVKGQGAINIPILAAKKGDTPNTVVLRRKALGKGVAYVWQFSLDPFSEASWVDAGESTIAQFIIGDLESLKRYWFRVAVVKRTTQGDWTDPVTFVVS